MSESKEIKNIPYGDAFFANYLKNYKNPNTNKIIIQKIKEVPYYFEVNTDNHKIKKW